MNTLFAVGEKAPDFTLRLGNGNLGEGAENFFTLSELKGQNVILAFYPADFSTICSSQIALYNELVPVFKSYNAVCIGISVDGTFCHQAFKHYNNISLSLLSDFEPKGKLSKQYGAYNEKTGMCERAIYVIDKEGIVQYSYLSPAEVNPGAKDILDTLKKISTP